MKSNKMLYVTEAYINLPEDFEGTLGEALSIWANYTLEQEAKDKVQPCDEDGATLEALENDDAARASVSYELAERVNGKWQKLKSKRF